MTKPNYLLIIFLFLFSNFLFSQNNESTFVEGAPNVFLDCEWDCDFDAFRNNIKFVNFVRDRQSSDIHILVTSQSIGSGGDKYTLYFTGLNEYDVRSDTISIFTENDDTDKEENDALMEAFKEGMLAYMMLSPLKSIIDYSVDIKNEDNSTKQIIDPWNSWVISIGSGSFVSAESNYNYFYLWGYIRANRITKKDKIRLNISSNYSESNFYFRDSLDNIIDSNSIKSIQKSKYFNASYVHGVSDHLSLGFFYNLFDNINNNYNLSTSLKMGVEYNFYNFEDSDRKQLILRYEIGPSFRDYVDETIYSKNEEWTFSESLEFGLYQKQNWGNLYGGIEFNHYLHNIKLNRLRFNLDIDWNVLKGLTLGVGGSMTFISDQINLPKTGLEIEEVLLRNRLLATNYSLFGNFNIKYSFGSKYNNVVNARFD